MKINYKSIITAIFLTAAASQILWLTPIFFGMLIDKFGYNESQAGIITAADWIGYTVVCLTSIFWIQRVNWRMLAFVGCLLLAVGNLLSMVPASFSFLIMSRLLAGIGNGILISTAFLIFSDTDNPERFIGFALATQILVAVLELNILPSQIASNGTSAFFIIMLIVTAIATVLTPLLQTKAQNTSVLPMTTKMPKMPTPVLWAILGNIAAQAGVMGLNGFLERLGNHSALTAETIGFVLALGLAIGFGGSFLAGILGDKFGQWRPILISQIFLFMGSLMLLGTVNTGTFLVASVLFYFSWNFMIAYQLGAVAANDRTKVFVAMGPGAQGLGFLIGLLWGGKVAALGGLNALIYSAMALNIISLACFYIIRKPAITISSQEAS